ncbi:MAG: DUF1801 domain-containing protein [bacterium]
MPSGIKKPETIDQYIAQAPVEAREKLQQMRECIRTAAPKATEGIKWSMPAFSDQRILVMFAAFKRHIGFYPTASGVAAFEKELFGYTHAKGSIQFPLDKPLPQELVKKITEFRVRESEDGDGKWKG